ncbi:uncharacterized protein FFB20_07372 [Fusarium fujikuroi]|uniref:Uncharacterized protein n=2 Tax=Fusarium fujikuroi TaxID=5127 RepID=S0EF19_GIBF5|nr:uncharacterized protein FFUJ_08998 [Fusarium fujikuroi IMI 58289]KLO99368.1 uncharacterized protein Y057_15000 [Fusarium fujikuroi]QGI66692.1 hypothetical protein CEK27_010663 [Fusarium fujikuroi]QGI83930.1 hypothetical protein CEK25_010659 [Fusarium fujikuroi]QGI97580.1 hypothetical protein CEK26_010649 [Fusarium fujikuroi]CCT70973.1 uncharacterized protein FFUJ_08998 [Fusarium fujikuroi IMI 58289]
MPLNFEAFQSSGLRTNSFRQLSTNAPKLSRTTSATAQIPDKAAASLYTQQDSNAIDFDDPETADWPA